MEYFHGSNHSLVFLFIFFCLYSFVFVFVFVLIPSEIVKMVQNKVCEESFQKNKKMITITMHTSRGTLPPQRNTNTS